MMTGEIVATTEDGRYRVALHYDETGDRPDYDGGGHVFAVDRRGVSTLAVATGYGDRAGECESLRYAIAAAWERFADWDLVTRYLRQSHDVVSVDLHDCQDWTLVMVATRELAEAWQCPRDTWAESANLAEWRDWAEGEVYWVEVQERVDWAPVDRDDHRVMSTWESVETLGGLYGREWAEHEARELLEECRL